jgi:hypothetical protein
MRPLPEEGLFFSPVTVDRSMRESSGSGDGLDPGLGG